MIHYTILPDELVWQGYNQMEKKAFKEVHVAHMTMIVEQISETEAQIVRLISPNPHDYMNPKYFPGTKIAVEPIFN